MDNTEKDVRNRLDYLYKAAHRMYSTNPLISSHLMLEFIVYAQENDVIVDKQILQTFCNNCGSIFVGTINCSINIKSELVLGSRQNFVCYSCLVCHQVTKIMVQLKDGNNVAKTRKKNKNKASLSNLLQKKPKMEQSYSLQDFLNDN